MGVQIEEDQDTMEEQNLTIANDDLETEEQEEAVTEQPQLEQLQDGTVDDDMNDAENDYDVLENEIDAQNNEDGMIMLPGKI